jgi:hypothetical protein
MEPAVKTSKTLVGYTYDHLKPSDRFWFDPDGSWPAWFDDADIIDSPMPKLKMTTKITITVEIEYK